MEKDEACLIAQSYLDELGVRYGKVDRIVKVQHNVDMLTKKYNVVNIKDVINRLGEWHVHFEWVDQNSEYAVDELIDSWCSKDKEIFDSIDYDPPQYISVKVHENGNAERF